MPLYKNFSDECAKIWIWKYDELESLKPEKLLLPEEYQRMANYHPKRLKELLIIRKILHKFLPNYKILHKKSGEPYLEPNDFHISISHSFPFAVLAVSKCKIGVDLEKITPKILNVKNKFINTESVYITEEKEKEFLTSIWCIKESLYKLHQSNLPSLRENYEVFSFTFNNLNSIKCRVYNEDFSDYFYAKLRLFDDFLFSVVVETC